MFSGTAAFVITAVACGSIFVIIIIVATVLIAKKQRNNDTLRLVIANLIMWLHLYSVLIILFPLRL